MLGKREVHVLSYTRASSTETWSPKPSGRAVFQGQPWIRCRYRNPAFQWHTWQV